LCGGWGWELCLRHCVYVSVGWLGGVFDRMPVFIGGESVQGPGHGTFEDRPALPLNVIHPLAGRRGTHILCRIASHRSAHTP
jgi:hypothetical protein